jgi:hypothetical protein
MSVADLAEFLRARLDEDKRAALEWGYIPEPISSVWLADIDIKRRIIDLWEDPAEVENLSEGVYDGRDPDQRETQIAVAEAIDGIVRLLALPYISHPDYFEGWRP